ncbi:uncharacterized protein LOC133793934 [Humulus lupulus]|uniref:uncharacterized protein LOC133793934 n=1 Tax=Humulus lupulus TaxID=3486 RepID=UPI002B411AC1|nr:uncharacterized protein LOC133793934 [Humulus lupulus]
MSIICCFFIFLLCLSKQSSCEARQIGVHQKGAVEMVQIQMELTKGGVVLTKGENYIMASDDEAGDAGATATTQGKMSSSKSSETSIKERLKHIRGKFSGKKIFESLSDVGLLKATQIKEPRRRGLSVKEDVDFNNTSKVEDHVVVSDYEPPHGTPPIHNRET